MGQYIQRGQLPIMGILLAQLKVFCLKFASQGCVLDPEDGNWALGHGYEPKSANLGHEAENKASRQGFGARDWHLGIEGGGGEGDADDDFK